jgi:small conductance mechanosensitive channel
MLVAIALPADRVAAQDDGGQGPPATTAADPRIAVEELALALVPLRRAALEEEVEAWLGVLGGKARQISQAEIEARGAEGEAKASLLGRVAELQVERAALVERTERVIAAFERKGGDAGEYRQYVSAVARGGVDISDVGGLWVRLRNWGSSPDGGIRWLGNIAACLGTLLAFWILARLLGAVVGRSLGRLRQASSLMRKFLVNFVRKATLLVGLVIAASMLGIDIGPLLAAIGAAGFILAFALQESLGNFASGLMILLYRPFDVDDFVSVAGVSGKVETMTLVSTSIKTPDNRLIIVPNGSVWGDVITNVTGCSTRRVDMTFGIAYGDDVDQARRVLEEVVDADGRVLDDPPPVIRMNELADSSVNFVVRPWVKTEDYWDVYWDVMREVKLRFDAQGISIPFPQRDVYVHQVAAGA